MAIGTVAVVDGACVAKMDDFDQFVVVPVMYTACLLATSRIAVWRKVSARSPVAVSVLTNVSPLPNATFSVPCTYSEAIGEVASMPHTRACLIDASVRA